MQIDEFIQLAITQITNGLTSVEGYELELDGDITQGGRVSFDVAVSVSKTVEKKIDGKLVVVSAEDCSTSMNGATSRVKFTLYVCKKV